MTEPPDADCASGALGQGTPSSSGSGGGSSRPSLTASRTLPGRPKGLSPPPPSTGRLTSLRSRDLTLGGFKKPKPEMRTLATVASVDGIFDKANGTGGGGHVQMIQKAMKTLTFRSLCFPDTIRARGMDNAEELPTYFYRDDGYKVWDAIKSFVSAVVNIYYCSDETVEGDEEIQAFFKDVYSFGMQDFDYCEFPKSLKSREELTEYLTVAIFTASAQHAAVNSAQYDWYSWIPNAPSNMRKPPPAQKGVADVQLIVDSLPDRGRSCWHLGAVWALSQYQDNKLYLGVYPDEHFIEEPVKEAMESFRRELADIGSGIKKRNEGKRLPFHYLSPDKIPNSVAL